MTVKLDLDNFDPLENGQDEFNKMSRVLDGMLHCKIQNTVYDNPLDASGEMNPGVVFRVSGSANGSWAGQDNNFAIGKETINPADLSTYNTVAAWNFVTPIEGFIVWMRTLSGHRQTFNSGGWMTPSLVADVGGESEATTVSSFNSLLAKLRAHGVIAT